MFRAILVASATRKQGGAVIKHLLAAKKDITIIATTRDVKSLSAWRLAQKITNIKLLEESLPHPRSDL
jgi:uncharacterized protein YbjT (DUF2867 family)